MVHPGRPRLCRAGPARMGCTMAPRANLEPKLVRWVRRMQAVLARARVPHRRSRYANRVFSDHHHAVLLALRAYWGWSYRRLVEVVAVATRLAQALGLRRVPHWTTLQKFDARQTTARLEACLAAFLPLARLRRLHVAVDSTGYVARRQSSHYSWVLVNHRGRSRRRAQRPLKATIAIDWRRRLVAAVRLRWGPGPDAPDFVPVLDKVRRAGVPIRWVTADKAYDSEAHQVYVRRDLGARPMIPVRANPFGGRDRGLNRWRQRREFDPRVYRNRTHVEGVISVVKRLQGDDLRGRHAAARRHELLWRAMAYNAHRLEGGVTGSTQGFY